MPSTAAHLFSAYLMIIFPKKVSSHFQNLLFKKEDNTQKSTTSEQNLHTPGADMEWPRRLRRHTR
jgi:hypothetical protein